MFSNCFNRIFPLIVYICSLLGPSRLGQIGNFGLELGKNILFGIGNGTEFQPKTV